MGVNCPTAEGQGWGATRAASYPAWFASTRVATSRRPVLLRVFADEGHVLRPAVQVAHIVDMLAFAYWQTGEPNFQPVAR